MGERVIKRRSLWSASVEPVEKRKALKLGAGIAFLAATLWRFNAKLVIVKLRSLWSASVEPAEKRKALKL